MCNDPDDNENGVVHGKIHNANNLSAEITEFVKPFGRGQKKFPHDFERKDFLIGNPADEFDLDYRLIGRKNTHHVYGKASCMPKEIVEIMRIFVKRELLSKKYLNHL